MYPKSQAKATSPQSATKYPGLNHQPERDPSAGPLFQAVRRFLRAQFGHPKGALGRVVGKIMERTPSNNERIRWTISLLDVGPRDRLLEVGMGPGIAIKLLSDIAREGLVAGIDHSEVMVRQAIKRNAEAIHNGRVKLQLGSASNLPGFGEPFDKIFTINSIHFWPDPIHCLRELRHLLKPNGLIAVTFQPRSRGATDAIARQIGEEIVTDLQQAGFSHCRLELRKASPVSMACALGSN